MLAPWNNLMYSVIDQNRDAILKVLEREEKNEKALSKYEWLVQSVRQEPWPTYSDGSTFEGVYTSFWVIQGVGSAFRTEYFKRLKAGCNQTPEIAQICTDLLPLSTRKKKGSEETIQTLQFSFPSKLCHMLDPHFPIYDSNVQRFYLYQEPPRKLPFKERINGLVAFHSFLIDEYARILTKNLLKEPIEEFKQKFKPQQHSDEKIVDWLIWAFIEWVDEGALRIGSSTSA